MSSPQYARYFRYLFPGAWFLWMASLFLSSQTSRASTRPEQWWSRFPPYQMKRRWISACWASRCAPLRSTMGLQYPRAAVELSFAVPGSKGHNLKDNTIHCCLETLAPLQEQGPATPQLGGSSSDVCLIRRICRYDAHTGIRLFVYVPVSAFMCLFRMQVYRLACIPDEADEIRCP